MELNQEKNNSENKRSKGRLLNWLSIAFGHLWKFKDDAGSLNWRSRIGIYGLSLLLAFFISTFIAKFFLFFLDRYLDFNFESPQYIVGMFFLIAFGVGVAFVRTVDIKKQFQDTFIQKNEQRFERAINLFCKKDDPLSQSIGLKLLANIKNDPLTKSYGQEIDSITSGCISLKHAKLSGANLRNAKLSRANLKEADLSNADLSNADLSNADLSGANLRSAKLSRANLKKADLSICRVTPSENLMTHGKKGGDYLSGKPRSGGADLKYSDLSYADLRDADLSGDPNLMIKGADLKFAKLFKARLQNANLYRASLIGADLSGAYLQKTKLDGAHLEETNLKDAKYNEETTFPKRFDPEKHGMKKVHKS